MEDGMYLFNVEDRVLCASRDGDAPRLPGVVVGRQPNGGGETGKDPLYTVQLDQPLGASHNVFFSSYTPSSRIISFHGQFLRLLEPCQAEEEAFTGLTALL